MISSRMAEPETAAKWAVKMIKFSNEYANQIESAKAMSSIAKRTVSR